MELWNRARSFAEEASKRSNDLSLGASKLSDIITETTKEIAAQASKHLPQPFLTNDVDLHRFGITEELREFVKGITITTFEDFPLRDDTEFSDVPAVSNVRQDLSDWQEKHASLVLSTVKEISRLRYELCPRVMKERKFWRIYFILVNNHTAPLKILKDLVFYAVNFCLVISGSYENQYMEDEKLKSCEQVKDHIVTMRPLNPELICNQEAQEVQKDAKLSNSSTGQDLDEFLLGEGNSDDEPDDGDRRYDDDLDKLMDNSVLIGIKAGAVRFRFEELGHHFFTISVERTSAAQYGWTSRDTRRDDRKRTNHSRVVCSDTARRTTHVFLLRILFSEKILIYYELFG
ncbi:hypothetical protein ACSQ67_006975 [Phaseolus vulgaris]